MIKRGGEKMNNIIDNAIHLLHSGTINDEILKVDNSDDLKDLLSKHGYHLSADDVDTLIGRLAQDETELTETDLQAVSGGAIVKSNLVQWLWKKLTGSTHSSSSGRSHGGSGKKF